MKTLTYDEPLPCCRSDGTLYAGNIKCIISHEDAIGASRTAYQENGMQFPDDETLLADFKAVHWAEEVQNE